MKKSLSIATACAVAGYNSNRVAADPYADETVLLLNGNGSEGSTTILDSTDRHAIITYGDARIRTSEKKYGTGSMYFDGYGDYLTIPASEDFNFGTGDFTVEFWINFEGIFYDQVILDNLTSVYGFMIEYWNGRFYVGYNGNSIFHPVYTITRNTWYYLTVVRNNGVVSLYVNGSMLANVSYPYAINCSSGLMMAKYPHPTAPYHFQGFIDDFRITKGIARYTSDFTVPNKELTV